MGISKAWQAFERVVASTWGSFRVPLSGINSRHNAGDVILPDDVEALLECKTRKSSSFWTLWKSAQDDAVKNNIDPAKTVLYFKLKGAKGYIATVDGEMFAKMISIPEVRELFKKGGPTAGNSIPTTRQRVRKTQSQDQDLSTDRRESKSGKSGDSKQRRPPRKL